jgi:hypothetical protein
MIVQDLPFTGRADRRAKATASRLAESITAAIDGYGSVIDIWCEDVTTPPDTVGRGDTGEGDDGSTALASSLVDRWHRMVFERAVAETVKRTDPSRPILDRTVQVPLNLFGPPRPANLFADPDHRPSWIRAIALTPDVVMRNWPRATRFLAAVDTSDDLAAKRIIEWTRSLPAELAASFFVKLSPDWPLHLNLADLNLADLNLADLNLTDRGTEFGGAAPGAAAGGGVSASGWPNSLRTPLPVADVPLRPLNPELGFAIPLRVLTQPPRTTSDPPPTEPEYLRPTSPDLTDAGPGRGRTGDAQLDVKLSWETNPETGAVEHVHSWRFRGSLGHGSESPVATIQIGPLGATGVVRLVLRLDHAGGTSANEYLMQVRERPRPARLLRGRENGENPARAPRRRRRS